jgi:hypothetical protein
MAKVKPLNAAQLRSLQENLDADLAAVYDAHAKAKRKLEELSAPAYLKRYKPEALEEIRREQREAHARSVLDVIKSLPGRKQLIEDQLEYWEKGFWRDAQLYPPPPEIKIGDSASLLRSERDVQALAEFIASSNRTLAEDTGRLRLMRELELMDSDAFTKVVEEASERGAAAAIYLARLVADTRPWRSDMETARAKVALMKAEREINLPERTQALEALQNARGLALDVESAYRSLATGQEDVRARVTPTALERNTRLAAEKAAQEERKQNLEAIEDGLIVKGAV